ncbi:MAG TPA: HIRAN domain-containing protein [Mycobacteriales bacterium]|nr:HIRAN domain-containing protein [Mycobacteriales bacterium]
MTDEPAGRRLRRFLVTWRDGEEQPSIHDVGCLSFDGAYRFQYLPGARAAPGFRPLPGLPDLADTYGPAPDLFPVFAGRVMERTRPDFASYMAALDLPVDADDLDVLARSGGVTRGDRLVLTEEPSIGPDGSTRSTFLVRGLRFALPEPALRERVLAPLHSGDRLTVRPEAANDISPDALQVCTADDVAVGWVPDALTHWVRRVLSSSDGSFLVRRNNGPEHPPHARLLVDVHGHLPPGTVTLPGLGRRAAEVRA